MRWDEMTVRDLLILIAILFLGITIGVVCSVTTVHAQGVDLERTLPDLVGKSIEEVESVLGRPDEISTIFGAPNFYYTRWRGWFVGLNFKEYRGQWVLDTYSLHRRSGLGHHYPLRPR